MGDIKHKLVRMFPALAVTLALVVTVWLVYALKSWLDEEPESQKKIVQQITLITPPPPPPPPPEEQPPEPEQVEEIEQPEEQIADEIPEDSSEAPPGADLGVDGEGSGAGDGFGLIGKKGGHGLLEGSPFAWYEGLMVSEIQDLLANIEELKSTEYVFRIKIKLSMDGKVSGIQLVRSTGDRNKDELLMTALGDFVRFSRMPPARMPSIVDLKITSTI